MDKQMLKDLIDELETELFYVRAANKLESKDEFVDASYLIAYLREKLLRK